MVSLSDGDDPHFRKARFDPRFCPSDCPRPCQRVCPALAIGAVGGVEADRCYGCGRCRPACPLGLIQERQTVLSAAAVPALLAELAQRLGARLDVEVHDYQAICPRINLSDEEGRYCGEPDERGCDLCLAQRGSKYPVKSIREWRHANARLLERANCIYVPDQDVADRLGRYLPGLEFEVDPHEEFHPEQLRITRPQLRKEEPLRVVIIGAIGKVKGYSVLLACAKDAREKRLPIEFSLLGYSMNDARLRQAGVSISGRYLEDEALGRLKALEPHLIWLPSLWPVLRWKMTVGSTSTFS
jgi:Fe-S-cluster-containing hydrogenase component 2